MTYEQGFINLEGLVQEFESDRLIKPAATESDTRAKLITRILTEVLGWSEEAIRREEKTRSGYMDYLLHSPNPVLVVEAKRFGKWFVFPSEKKRSSYALRTLRSEHDNVGKAVRQVRDYCDDNGIEYAAATNGAQWIIFKAITVGQSWSSGRAFVFRSLEDIRDRFTDFWNLLSASAVRNGSLAEAFDDGIGDRLDFQRPLDNVLYADNSLQRNPLSVQLQPLISAVFRDLTGDEEEEVLKRCYVFDRKVEGVWQEVRSMFDDRIPEFAKRAGFIDLVETNERSGALDDKYRAAVRQGEFGTTILLLGGVGSGKTTFIHRFFRISARDFVDKFTVWSYVPFTEAPSSSDDFGGFVRLRILKRIRDQYPKIDICSLGALRKIYSSELDERRNGVWGALGEEAQNQREADFLQGVLDSEGHCDAVLKYLRSLGVVVTIVLDNVDQRAPEEQVGVFLLAHELCRSFDAVIIVALREESFFKAEQAGAFNAYHNIRYHIASPDVRKLLAKRIGYALEVSDEGTEALRVALRSGVEFDAEQIRDFLRIVNSSVLRENPAIHQFIDATSHGNMRAALEMFNQFLVSGTTDVEKMLRIYKEQGGYSVAEHEFIKAVMHGDFQFYRGERSVIVNLFEVSGSPQASNFTTVRLLRYLDRQETLHHPEGRGFVELDELLARFAEAFGRSGDAEFHLRRLLKARLVEADNQQIDGLAGVGLVRITPCGIYYFKILAKRFQYLDAVALDSPCWDSGIVAKIRNNIQTKDLYRRIARVENFLQYLIAEENRSLQTVPLSLAEKLLATGIADDIKRGVQADINRVVRKARLNSDTVEEIRQQVKGCGVPWVSRVTLDT